MKLKANDFLDAVQKQENTRTQTQEKAILHQDGMDAHEGTRQAVYDAVTLLKDFIAKNEPKVTVKNQVKVPKTMSVPQIDHVAQSLAELLVATKDNKYDDKLVASKLDKVASELKSLPRDIKFPDIPKPLDTVKVSNQIDYNQKFDELAKTFSSIEVAPVVKVSTPKVTVNNDEVAKVVNELKDVIISAVSGIEMPDIPSTDLKPLIEAVRASTKAIESRPVVKPPSTVTALNESGSPIGNALSIPAHDNGTVAYPTTTQEVYTFKDGATTVGAVTIDYTDSTKAAMSAWSFS